MKERAGGQLLVKGQGAREKRVQDDADGPCVRLRAIVPTNHNNSERRDDNGCLNIMQVLQVDIAQREKRERYGDIGKVSLTLPWILVPLQEQRNGANQQHSEAGGGLAESLRGAL